MSEVQSPLKAKIQKSMTDAMKAKDAPRLQVIRMIFSNIRKKEIDGRKDIDDAEVERTLLTQLKQTQETLEQATKAAAQATIDEANFEIKVIKEFLPESLSEADVLKIVQSVVDTLKAAGTLPAGGAAMGAVMKESMAKIGSRSEGKIIQGAVRKALGM